MLEPDREPLELLAALVAAASEGHTRRTLLRRLADLLAQRLPLQRIELGEPQGDDLELLTASPGAATILSKRQPLTTDLAAALRTARPLDRGGHGPVGAQRRVVIPLADAAPASSLLILWLGPAAVPDPLTPALILALGRVLLHLLRGQDVTQRVAELSRRAHLENRELRDRQRDPGPALVARSPAMQDALARLAAVARFATPVLLSGESGTGKELLAQRLHRLSPRGHRPLIAINCGALPPQLVESALFGHEPGAFTGASKRHRGVFERADRGTLFLDEIGELPLAVQVKLLRALQTQEFERVGGEERVKVDVRVVAATHRDLEQMVSAGAFRRDLYYRLCVFPIRVPPLRDRLDELPALTAALLADIAARLGLPAPRVSPALLARLRRHSWPGNVRELGNVLESAMILGGDPLEPTDLPPSPEPPPPAPTLERLDDATRRCITAALAACNGRIYGPTGAARALGLNPATLQSKLRKLAIDREHFIRDTSDRDP